MNGTQLPNIVSEIPGPNSRLQVETLGSHECPAITARRDRRARALSSDHDDPIVWQEAVGANVRDADGNIFVDLTSGFGVALAGHRHPAVVAAAQAQMGRLIHASGDAWPDVQRISLLRRLAKFSPQGLDVVILGSSGADAVEAAIKTALLATGKPGIITFEGSYHGLSLGTLPLQAYRTRFSTPFGPHLSPHVTHLPWGCQPIELERALAKDTIGLVLAEPIQGRGGVRPAPAEWLAQMAAITRAQGALFALDEIQTGLGRTGSRFACENEGVIPDLMCVGKALGGGFPISACLGTHAVMQTWGASSGEAIHTQTFLGHPVGCAAGLAMLDLLEHGDLL
ncbi:MAG TPA: aspartate aminotransferase family protein, partial [Planctomycetes bacterium]|nr:aspartate aminotransferase family protein [Planctomycetota bacterium]